MKSRKIRQSQEKGIILVVVLWVLFFLSIVCITLGTENRMNMRIQSLRNEQLRMFYLAQEGIDRAIIALSEDEVEFDGVGEQWCKDFSLQKEAALLSYKVVDEDRFLNINSASRELLDNIELVFPEITSQIIDNIDELRPFNLTQEVIDRVGIDKNAFYADTVGSEQNLGDLITVFSDGKININTAPDMVLMMIPDMSEAAAEAIIAKRQDVAFKEDSRLSDELSVLGLSPQQISSLLAYIKVTSSVFRIKVEASSRHKHISKSMEIVVARTDGKFKVLFFKES